MSATLFDAARRDEVLRRIDALRADQRPLWGRMTADAMVNHLNAAFQQALGELDVRPPHGPLSHWPLNWLLIHVLPWPKGKAKAPREFLPPTTTWEADVATLRALITRFAARGANAEWNRSLVFGNISGKSWGVLAYKHADHHLRQFGV